MEKTKTVPGIDDVVAARQALREKAPLVHCITNAVSANVIANGLLAAGASPAMVDNVHEAGLFAGMAGALLVNLGTPQEPQVAAMRLATAAARAAGRPWVLDPVAVGALPWRSAIARDLLAQRPALIRGNASEIIGLAGLGGGGRGVDSAAETGSAVRAAVALLDHAEAVSASGAVDHLVGRVEDRVVVIRVSGGSALLPRVTATGCLLGALTAAYAAVVPDALTALLAAHVHLKVAAERAAAEADRPGRFAVALIDALDAVEETALRRHARIEAAIPVERKC